jgi:hypothetical protein
MNAEHKAIARQCLEAAESDMRTFPAIVGDLIAAGFESYTIDLRRAVAIYYLPNGDSVELATHDSAFAVASEFDTDALTAAIREAQTLARATPTRTSALKPRQQAALAISSCSSVAGRSISAHG